MEVLEPRTSTIYCRIKLSNKQFLKDIAKKYGYKEVAPALDALLDEARNACHKKPAKKRS